jgi:multidrug efflux pump subunit AcrA (membrane-fusion protein)
MKKAVLLSAAVIVLVGCGSRGTEIKAAKVKRGELVSIVNATGTVRSNNEAKLTTVASGRIEKIFVEENQKVEKGELLLELESAEQYAKDYGRMKSLGDKGFVTSQQVELAKQTWENTFIAAPFSGTIAKKYSFTGETLFAGTSALLLADLNDLVLETNIDETDIGKVKTGQTAHVILDAYKNTKIPAKIQFIAKSSLDLKEKGITYLVKAKLADAPVVLRLGMTGDINIDTESVKDALMIPYSSVAEERDYKYVYAVESNVLVKKKIRTGIESYEFIQIIAGLKEGDLVAESGLSKLKEGQKVKIINK